MQESFQQMQLLEQNLQNLMFQKQAFNMELSETSSALEELEKSGQDVFKIIGQLILKKQKDEVKKELEEKKKILEVRLNSIEKQEKTLTEKVQEQRDDLLKNQNKSK